MADAEANLMNAWQITAQLDGDGQPRPRLGPCWYRRTAGRPRR